MTDKEIIINMCKQLVNGITFADANCDGLSCEDCPFDEENNDYICCGSDSDRNYKEIAKEFLKNNGVDKMKTEKTFKEVIADIKDGEVWESEEKENKTCNVRIKKFSNALKITNFDNEPLPYFPDNFKYKLQRKQYTFIEAFAAYEEGKEIESEVTGDIFKKQIINNIENGIFINNEFQLNSSCLFSVNVLRGKWYINN